MAEMPRKIRVEYPGAIYHVMSRGDRREDSFLDDVGFLCYFCGFLGRPCSH